MFIDKMWFWAVSCIRPASHFRGWVIRVQCLGKQVTIEQVLLPNYCDFPQPRIIQHVLHTHLLSGAGTTCPFEAAVEGLSLTPACVTGT
jgi:hypothetical protein